MPLADHENGGGDRQDPWIEEKEIAVGDSVRVRITAVKNGVNYGSTAYPGWTMYGRTDDGYVFKYGNEWLSKNGKDKSFLLARLRSAAQSDVSFSAMVSDPHAAEPDLYEGPTTDAFKGAWVEFKCVRRKARNNGGFWYSWEVVGPTKPRPASETVDPDSADPGYQSVRHSAPSPAVAEPMPYADDIDDGSIPF